MLYSDEKDYNILFLLSITSLSHGEGLFSRGPSVEKDPGYIGRLSESRAAVQADGTRYLLLINWLGVYLVDRSFRVRRVQMRFPCPGLKARHHCTLLDGEMVRIPSPACTQAARA